MEAADYFRTGSGPWVGGLGTALTLRLAVDEGDSWAVSTAPQLEAQLEAGGFEVSIIPEISATLPGWPCRLGRPIWL